MRPLCSRASDRLEIFQRQIFFGWKLLRMGGMDFRGNRTHITLPCYISCRSLDKSEKELTELHASDGNQQKRQKHLHLARTLDTWSLGSHRSSPPALMAHLPLACHEPFPTQYPILLEKQVWLSYKWTERAKNQSPPPAVPSCLFILLGEENEGLRSGQ